MIGIFIGSFNPPTLAHLSICLDLKNRYKKIVFVPVNSQSKYLASFNDRINMLSIYKRKYSFLEIDNIMHDYSYLNYRILDLLKKKYGNIELIIGSDILEKIPTFDNYEYLIENFKYLIVTRFKVDVEQIIKERFLDYQNNFKVFKFDSDISSTKARELIKKDEDTKGILDKDVYLYIKNKQIYF